MASSSSPSILFAGTLHHIKDKAHKQTGISLNTVKFKNKVAIQEVRVIPRGFKLPVEGLDVIGETTPATFDVKFYVDPRKPSSTFESFARLNFANNKLARAVFVVKSNQGGPSSTQRLIIAGSYQSVTICILGVDLSKRQKSSPDKPRARTRNCEEEVSDRQSKRSKSEVTNNEPVPEYFTPCLVPNGMWLKGLQSYKPKFGICYADIGARVLKGHRNVHILHFVGAPELNHPKAALALQDGQTRIYNLLAKPEFESISPNSPESLIHEWIIALESTLPALQRGICSLVDEANPSVVSLRTRLLEWVLLALGSEMRSCALAKTLSFRLLKVGILYAKTIWQTSYTLGDALSSRGAQRLLSALTQENNCSTMLMSATIALDASLGTTIGITNYTCLKKSDTSITSSPASELAAVLSQKTVNVRLVVAIEKITRKAQLVETLFEFQVLCQNYMEKLNSNEHDEAFERNAVIELLESIDRQLQEVHELHQSEPNQFPDNVGKQSKLRTGNGMDLGGAVILPPIVLHGFTMFKTIECISLLANSLLLSTSYKRVAKTISSIVLYLLSSRGGIMILGQNQTSLMCIVQSLTGGDDHFSKCDLFEIDSCLRKQRQFDPMESGEVKLFLRDVGWLLACHISALYPIYELTVSRNPSTTHKSSEEVQNILQNLLSIKNLSVHAVGKHSCARVAVLFGTLPWLLDFVTSGLPSTNPQKKLSEAEAEKGKETKVKDSRISKEKTKKLVQQDTLKKELPKASSTISDLHAIASRWCVSLLMSIIQDKCSTSSIAQYGVRLANLKVRLQSITETDTELLRCLSDIQAWMLPITSIKKQNVFSISPLTKLISSVGIHPNLQDSSKVPALMIALRYMCFVINECEAIDILSGIHDLGMSVATATTFVAKLLDLCVIDSPDLVSPLLSTMFPILDLAKYCIEVNIRSNSVMGNFTLFRDGLHGLFGSLYAVAGGNMNNNATSTMSLHLQLRAKELSSSVQQIFEHLIIPDLKSVGSTFDATLYQQEVSLPTLEKILTCATMNVTSVKVAVKFLSRVFGIVFPEHFVTNSKSNFEVSDESTWGRAYCVSLLEMSGQPAAKMVTALACTTVPATRTFLRAFLEMLSQNVPTVSEAILKSVNKEAGHVVASVQLEKNGKQSFLGQVKFNVTKKSKESADDLDLKKFQILCYLGLIDSFLRYEFFFEYWTKDNDILQDLFGRILRSDQLRDLVFPFFINCVTAIRNVGNVTEAHKTFCSWIVDTLMSLLTDSKCGQNLRSSILRIVFDIMELQFGMQFVSMQISKNFDILSDMLLAVVTGYQVNGSIDLGHASTIESSAAIVILYCILKKRESGFYLNADGYEGLILALRKALLSDKENEGVFHTVKLVLGEGIPSTEPDHMFSSIVRLAKLAGELLVDEGSAYDDEALVKAKEYMKAILTEHGSMGTNGADDEPVVTLDVAQFAKKYCPTAIKRFTTSRKISVQSASSLATNELPKRQFKKLEGQGIALGTSTFRSARDGGKTDRFRTVHGKSDARAASMHVDDFMRLEINQAEKSKSPKYNGAPSSRNTAIRITVPNEYANRQFPKGQQDRREGNDRGYRKGGGRRVVTMGKK